MFSMKGLPFRVENANLAYLYELTTEKACANKPLYHLLFAYKKIAVQFARKCIH